ncbi:MAG TPA: SMP-30/gluconolactonase/LRE family protein [Chloroflexia bacterium]|nr:SMP-30/gluconolactonase/LRE family protein [Chloroflexia bacterium]
MTRTFFFISSRRPVYRGLVILGLLAALVLVGGAAPHAQAAANADGNVFASSNSNPFLQFPEGITSWHEKVYIATYNIVSPQDSRILVYNAQSGHLMKMIGGRPGEELISNGFLLGLTIDPSTGDLYAAANENAQILRIQNPESDNPQVSIYATYPAGGGPEDLAFNAQGTLYASDSNLGVVYAVPPGGGAANLVIGPPGSGAPVSDNGLLQTPAGVAGLSPNGVVFSLDWRTLFVANTYSDSIIAFDVNAAGQVTGNARVFASNPNTAVEEDPQGFPGVYQPGQCIGACASTPLNGPDGLAIDSQGNLWVASILGDNLTVLDMQGHVLRTVGTSAVTANGVLNNPAGMTFVGDNVFCSNLGIFTNLPFQIAEFPAGVTGAGGNGNH